MDKVTTFDQFHDHHQDVHHRDHHDNHDGDDDHDNRIRMPGDPTPVVILGAFLAAIHTVSPVPGFLTAIHHGAVASRPPLVAPVLRAVSAPIVAEIAFSEIFTSNKNSHCHQGKACLHPSETRLCHSIWETDTLCIL